MAFGLGHPEGHRSVLPGQHRNRENIRLLISDNGSNITFAIVVGGLGRVEVLFGVGQAENLAYMKVPLKKCTHTHTHSSTSKSDRDRRPPLHRTYVRNWVIGSLKRWPKQRARGEAAETTWLGKAGFGEDGWR